MALIANCHRDPDKTPEFGMKDFHPRYAKSRRNKLREKVPITVLKQIFVKG